MNTVPLEDEECFAFHQWLDTNYEVNEIGEVRNSITKRVLKPWDNGNGYMVLTLIIGGKKKHFYVHRIVAEVFCDGKNNSKEVNHKNGIKSDNRKSNLEWVTKSENNLHKCRVLKRYGGPNKKVICVETGDIFESERQAARWAGLKYNHIGSCIENKRSYKTSGGYHWRYAE